MNYDYFEEMKKDVKEYLENTNERDFDNLHDEMWNDDSITGSASGSYTISTYKAEENICHNWDLLKEALEEFGTDFGEALEKGAEFCDVTIRCYLLGQVLQDVLDELEEAEEEEAEEVLKKLEELKGQNINEAYSNIIDCFNTEKEVIINKNENSGYDYIAYLNEVDSKEYLINVNENDEIVEVWRV